MHKIWPKKGTNLIPESTAEKEKKKTKAVVIFPVAFFFQAIKNCVSLSVLSSVSAEKRSKDENLAWRPNHFLTVIALLLLASLWADSSGEKREAF